MAPRLPRHLQIRCRPVSSREAYEDGWSVFTATILSFVTLSKYGGLNDSQIEHLVQGMNAFRMRFEVLKI